MREINLVPYDVIMLEELYRRFRWWMAVLAGVCMLMCLFLVIQNTVIATIDHEVRHLEKRNVILKARYEEIKKLDMIILAMNIYEIDSIKEINKELYENFEKDYNFQGSSVLAGIDVESKISSDSQIVRISQSDIINKAKELNILYTFEITNKSTDLSELFNKILDDFIYKIRIKTPELFDQSRNYGKELSIKKKSIRDKL